MIYGYSARLIGLNKKADARLLGVRLGRACMKNNVPVSQVATKLGGLVYVFGQAQLRFAN
jgi:hypothetical protein